MLRDWAAVTASTTTSVSTVRIDTLLYPSFTASPRCSRMWLSSSCVHGANTDYLFASVEGCHTGCQEGEQFSLLVFNAQKLWPVSRNDTGWLNVSMNSLPSLAACFSLQTFGEIFIPHDIDSANMLQLRACQYVEASNSPTTRAISGPDSIHRRRAAGFSVRPTASLSPFTEALFCSWAWSMAIAEKLHVVFFTAFPFRNCPWTSGWLSFSTIMSRKWTGVHPA
ncbi:uncharacterized protein LOC117498063 [Trematomus bernacchii]|uniref:uncharacterized protein LOC117498063 n=1 Tax=Trematomus bernacchii TaxID=40690 RepID=UPI00146C4826|nr:uncharacterized protein LOC117498063 [Trematomus bernacchii]